MMNKTDAVNAAFSFLAALAGNNADLYNQVYVPICKRALSLYNSKPGGTSGKWSDIKDVILSEYGINVPQIIIKQLINSVYKSLSNNEKKKCDFQVFSNGDSFQIGKYTFLDLEEQYKQGIRESNSLEVAFRTYMQTCVIFQEGIPTIYEFLDKNKQQLASFFSKQSFTDIDKSFFYHVEFFKYIEQSNPTLYKIAEKQYIGSIVAGFLEAGLALDPKFSSNETYFLDTPVALRALGLQREEDTGSTKELLELIQNTGGQIKILSITVNEISQVIENAINYYDNSTPNTTINEACIRMGKNKAWLMMLNAKLEERIQKDLNVSIVPVLNSFIEKHRHHPDVKALQATRMKTGNALHDVLSYMYIRQMRGNSVSAYQKAKIWFLTTNIELLKFNKDHTSNNVPEIIMADSLTSLLWLKNPVKLQDRVKKAGLNTLLSVTLDEELASRELITEFDNSIKSLDDISEDDYRLLLGSVAYQSAKNIESFNALVASDKAKAKSEAIRIIEQERTRKQEIEARTKASQKTIMEKDSVNQDLTQKLAQIEADVEMLTSKSQEKDLQATKQQIKDKRKNWIIFSLIIIVVALIAFILKDKFDIVSKIVSIVLNSICGLGGLWGLCNLILNLIKLKKESKEAP